MSGRFATLARGYLNRSTPGYMIFFVTPLCDCRCVMCFNREVIDHAAHRSPLRIEEIERIARNFPGLHHVNFSGGEPFLRKDFAEIPALFYRHSGTRLFACPTNSSHPDRIIPAVRNICESCPDAWVRITQSIDGIGEDHDAIRGKAGIFECVKTLNHELALLRKELPNLSVGMAMVLSKFNQGKEYDILEYVHRTFSFDDFGALYVRGDTHDPEAAKINNDAYAAFVRACREKAEQKAAGKSWTGKLFTAITRQASDLIMQSVVEDRFVTPCRAGKNMIVMDDEGRISPCEVLEYFIKTGISSLDSAVLGSMRENDYDIRKILQSDKARAIVAHIKESKCHCSFECAMSVNVLYSPSLWPGLIRHLF